MLPTPAAVPHDAPTPLAVQVQAEVDSGVGVKADFPSLRGDPGTAFNYTLTVTNNTPDSSHMTFSTYSPSEG